MPPNFLYFDLGNVLLDFSHERAARQMAEVSGAEYDLVWQTVFAGDLELRYEAGQLTSGGFYEAFCAATGTRPEQQALLYAGSAMFEMHVSMRPVVAMLKCAGYRIGILSNTCDAHWRYCADGRYSMIPDAFEVLALSFQIGAVKPDEKIYRVAADLAGVAPAEILFVDDKPANVAAAVHAGFDAVLYTTTAQYVADLRRRGVRFNY
jgi:putative hydrolase of the HAD superfamily